MEPLREGKLATKPPEKVIKVWGDSHRFSPMWRGQYNESAPARRIGSSEWYEQYGASGEKRSLRQPFKNGCSHYR